MERFSPNPTMTQYLQEANDVLLTMVQIETREALEEVDEIAAVDGIDVLFIGPFDLGMLSLIQLIETLISDRKQGTISVIPSLTATWLQS